MTLTKFQAIAGRGKPPTAGTIRLYRVRESGKGTEIIEQFLVTSPVYEYLVPLAEHVDGEITPWVPGVKDAESKDEWGLYAGTSLDVVLFGTPESVCQESYKLWASGKGGYMARNCDGSEGEGACTVPGDQGGLATCPCLCRQEGVIQCKPNAVLWPSLFHSNTTMTWQCRSGEANTVGGMGQAVRHAFLMSTRHGVAAGRLRYETATTRFKDPRTGEERNGIKAFPVLEPLSMASNATVGELLTAAETSRRDMELMAGEGGWGDAPALTAGPAAAPVVDLPGAAARVENPPPSKFVAARAAALAWQRRHKMNAPWTYHGYTSIKEVPEETLAEWVEAWQSDSFAIPEPEES